MNKNKLKIDCLTLLFKYYLKKWLKNNLLLKKKHKFKIMKMLEIRDYRNPGTLITKEKIPLLNKILKYTARKIQQVLLLEIARKKNLRLQNQSLS